MLTSVTNSAARVLLENYVMVAICPSSHDCAVVASTKAVQGCPNYHNDTSNICESLCCKRIGESLCDCGKFRSAGPQRMEL